MPAVLPFPATARPVPAVTAPEGTADPRRAMLADLARRVRAIEQARSSSRPHPTSHPIPIREEEDGRVPAPPSLTLPSPPLVPLSPVAPSSGWTFGDDALDGALAPVGLDIGATYEIKPAHAGAAPCAASRRAAATAFALRLAVRLMRNRRTATTAGRRSLLLWCLTEAAAQEFGRPYGHGAGDLGLDPASLALVAAAKPLDALWAAEEALKSRTADLVLLQADDIALTPARRLSLAARATETPCLLVTAPETAGVASVLYRWRVAPAASPPHRFDVRAPGAFRLAVSLERARSAAAAAATDDPVCVEWSDETLCFHLAAGVAARPVAASGAASRAG